MRTHCVHHHILALLTGIGLNVQHLISSFESICVVVVTASSGCMLHAECVLNPSILHLSDAVFAWPAHQVQSFFEDRLTVGFLS